MRARFSPRSYPHLRQESPKKGPTPHGRRKLDEALLPVETIVLEPPERTLPGGEALERIGEETAEHVDYRPGSLVRVRVVRPKYRRPGEATDSGEAPETPSPVLVAELPERPIPRGLAGPGLLAHVLVQKFANHQPLHRQEKSFRREGFPLPRSTLAGLVQGATTLLGPVVDAMWDDARANAAWIGIDATGVLVQAKERCKRGHFWVAVAARDHVLFRYSKKHDGEVPLALLEGFRGPVIADASSVYHELYRREPSITEVGCWAHTRRKFFDAMSDDKDRALVGVGFIGLLYDAHREATDPVTGLVDGPRRAALARPILDKLHRWLAEQRPLLDDDRPIKKAMNYVVNHRTHLERFLDDGALRLDNNPSELELRRQVVGRKNWLFCGSDDGAHWNAVATSLIASCELHGLDPWPYLRDVLLLLPTWPSRRVLDLCPKRWAQTREQPDTQERLRALRLLGRDDPSHGPEPTSGSPAVH